MIGGPPWSRRLLAAAGIFGLVFLTVPIVIVIPMSFSSARALTFPPPSLSLRWYEAFFGDPRWMEAMGTSAILAALSSIAALLLGGLAYVLIWGGGRAIGIGFGALAGTVSGGILEARFGAAGGALYGALAGTLLGVLAAVFSGPHGADGEEGETV